MRITDHFYNLGLDARITLDSVNNVIKRDHSNSAVTITRFCNLMKFKGTVPQLLRLLSSGGVWTQDIEKGIKGLVKCRVEEVSLAFPEFNLSDHSSAVRLWFMS